MTEVVPFRPLRYNLNKVRIDDVVAPPYDVISSEQQRALYQKSPFNVVRLILGLPEGEKSWHPIASRTKKHWEKEGILQRELEPSFFLYRQDYRFEGKEKSLIGFLGLVRLKPWGEGIYPHEKTLSKPKEDRFQLMLHCRANLCPIYSIYSDPDHEMEKGLVQFLSDRPLVDFVDHGENVRHRVWKTSDPQRVDRLRRQLEAKDLFVADGHHRYETALRYRDHIESSGERVSPNGRGLHQYILMFLTAMESPGITLLPTHRLLKKVPSWDAKEFLKKAENWFEVKPFPQEHSKAAEGIRFMTSNDTQGHLLQLNFIKANSHPRWKEIPKSLQSLDLVQLEFFLFKEVLGMTPDDIAQQRYLEYVKGEEKVTEKIRNKEGVAAFLMQPPTVSQIQAVALERQVMPQKSTYFYPKPLSGLIINPIIPTESVA
ncbi:MAG: DUF1015 domain-containing protein [Deltaproteobacteria bacterium]|nr:DUF1015 domain-containing protein [Deltaproteobacteria bacterium]